MATKLKRTYSLPAGKTIHGLKDAARRYFDSILNTEVSALPYGNDSYVIKCKTILHGIAKATGTEVNITLTLNLHGRQVEVHYLEECHNLSAWIGPVAIVAWPVGLCQLFGVASRRDIPMRLHSAMQSYLDA